MAWKWMEIFVFQQSCNFPYLTPSLCLHFCRDGKLGILFSPFGMMVLQCGPDSWASPGTLLEMHILRFHPRPDESEPWEWAQGYVFNMLSRGLWRENCCLRGFWAKQTHKFAPVSNWYQEKGRGTHDAEREEKAERGRKWWKDCWDQEWGGELRFWRAGVSNSCPWLCPWWLDPWPQQDRTGKAPTLGTRVSNGYHSSKQLHEDHWGLHRHSVRLKTPGAFHWLSGWEGRKLSLSHCQC